jgi:hypothetical protein
LHLGFDAGFERIALRSSIDQSPEEVSRFVNGGDVRVSESRFRNRVHPQSTLQAHTVKVG